MRVKHGTMQRVHSALPPQPPSGTNIPSASHPPNLRACCERRDGGRGGGRAAVAPVGSAAHATRSWVLLTPPQPARGCDDRMRLPCPEG